MTTTELIDAIRGSLQAAADPGRAAGAQAYMKSQMPSLGVRVPEVRRIVRAAAAEPPAGQPGGAAVRRACAVAQRRLP